MLKKTHVQGQTSNRASVMNLKNSAEKHWNVRIRWQSVLNIFNVTCRYTVYDMQNNLKSRK